MNRINQYGERDLISRIKAMVAKYDGHELSLDDASRIPFVNKGYELFVTTDPCPIPNIVQYLGMGDYYHAGWLSAIKSISDLAAVGAKPIGLTVAVEFPSNMNIHDFDLFFKGFIECAVEHETSLIGGNIKDAESNPIAVSFGVGATRKNRNMSRGCVNPGDIVYVVDKNSLGAFWAGIAVYLNKDKYPDIRSEKIEKICDHAKRPRAKVTEGRLLATKAPPSFCMDNSDGIIESCIEITKRQGVDLYLNLNNEIFPNDIVEIGEVCFGDPRVWAMAWGGYSLLCVSSHNMFQKAKEVLFNIEVEPVIIGNIREGTGQVFIENNNDKILVSDSSFFGGEHFRSSSFILPKQKQFLDKILTAKLEDILVEY